MIKKKEIIEIVNNYRQAGLLNLRPAGKNIKFKCEQCGKCCILPIILENKDPCKKFISAENIVPMKIAPRNFEVKKDNDGKCIFLKANNKCQIYNNRPNACRSYPFYLEPNTEDLFVDMGCPGVGKGEFIDYKKVKSITTDLSKKIKLDKSKLALMISYLFEINEHKFLPI